MQLNIVLSRAHSCEIRNHSQTLEFQLRVLRKKSGIQRVDVYKMCPRDVVLCAQIRGELEHISYCFQIGSRLRERFEIFGKKIKCFVAAVGLVRDLSEMKRFYERVLKRIFDGFLSATSCLK